MVNAEAIFALFPEMDIKPDEPAYLSIIDGYINNNNLDKALDWIMKMIDAGIVPSKYSFSIFQKCALKNPQTTFAYWFERTFRSSTRISEKALAQSTIGPLEREISQMQLLLKFLSSHPKYTPSPKKLANVLRSLGLDDDERAWEKILAYYTGSDFGKRRLDVILRQMSRLDLKVTNRFLSLLILIDYIKKSDENSWAIYDSMKESNTTMDGLIYRNLFLVAVQHDRNEKLKSLALEIMAKRDVRPLSPGILGSIIAILATHKKKGLLPHGYSANKRMASFKVKDIASNPSISPWSIYKFDAKIVHSLTPGDNELQFTPRISRNKIRTQIAIQLARYCFENKLWILEQDFGYLVDDAANTTDAETFLIEIHGLLMNLQEAELFQKYELLFFSRLFYSHNWNATWLFIQPYLRQPSSRQYGYLKQFIIERGAKRDASGLFSLWYHYQKRNLPSELIVLIIEQMGIYCKNPLATTRMWELISPAAMNEDIRWAYVRSLVWWGWMDKVPAACTTDYRPKPNDTGKVVVEICRWLKLKGLSDEEQGILNHWKSLKPEWIEKYNDTHF
jgi:pentatricopeptide repeat protein